MGGNPGLFGVAAVQTDQADKTSNESKIAPPRLRRFLIRHRVQGHRTFTSLSSVPVRFHALSLRGIYSVMATIQGMSQYREMAPINQRSRQPLQPCE